MAVCFWIAVFFSGSQCVPGLRCCFWFAVCFLLTAIWWFQECDGTGKFRCCYWEFKVYWIVEKEMRIRTRTEIAAEKKSERRRLFLSYRVFLINRQFRWCTHVTCHSNYYSNFSQCVLCGSVRGHGKMQWNKV